MKTYTSYGKDKCYSEYTSFILNCGIVKKVADICWVSSHFFLVGEGGGSKMQFTNCLGHTVGQYLE